MSSELIPATEIGLTWQELAETAYLAYMRAKGGMSVLLQNAEFGDLPDPEILAWLELSRLAWSHAMQEVEGSARELACEFYRFWTANLGLGKDLREQPAHEQVAWEAAARHLCYVISDMERGENLAKALDRWSSWHPSACAIWRQPCMKLPHIEIGQRVNWYPHGDTTMRPFAAICTSAGHDNICVAILVPNQRTLNVHDGVRFVGDERAMPPELLEEGCWDYSDETKRLMALERAVKQLEEKLKAAK